MSHFITPLSIFSNSIMAYCSEVNYGVIHLSPNELQQLMFYQPGSTVTPEDREWEKRRVDLHFEVKRAIARRYSFELLLNPSNQYGRFVEEQKKQGDKNKLTEAVFKALAKEAKELSSIERKVIRVTTMLTISDKAKETLDKNGYKEKYPNDSEDFLSWLSKEAIADKNLRSLFPILSELSDVEMVLLHKAYWPRTHLRHMMFTEGSIAMVNSLREGIKKGGFGKDDLKIWKWRWLTNLMGFQIPAGNYFNQEVLRLVNFWFKRLGELLKDSSQDVLHNATQYILEVYLKFRAIKAGFIESKEQGLSQEAKFLAHITSYFNQITILDSEPGKAVQQGYKNYIKNFPGENPAALYGEWSKLENAVTPTFVPAILNTAYVILKEKGSVEELVADTVQFTCTILNKLYLQLLETPENQISCMQLAKKENLTPILEAWQNNHQLDYEVKIKGREFLIAPAAKASLRAQL